VVVTCSYIKVIFYRNKTFWL